MSLAACVLLNLVLSSCSGRGQAKLVRYENGKSSTFLFFPVYSASKANEQFLTLTWRHQGKLILHALEGKWMLLWLQMVATVGWSLFLYGIRAWIHRCYAQLYSADFFPLKLLWGEATHLSKNTFVLKDLWWRRKLAEFKVSTWYYQDSLSLNGVWLQDKQVSNVDSNQCFKHGNLSFRRKGVGSFLKNRMVV